MKVINALIMILFLSCSGTQKKADIRKDHFTAKNASFRQCFVESDTFIRTKDDPAQAVVVRFDILETGVVKNAKIKESTMRDPNFHACLLDQVRQVKYPTRDSVVEVIEHINFYPEKQ